MYYKGKKVKRSASRDSDFHGFGDKIRTSLTSRLPKSRRVNVLDVGTGFGSNVRFLSKHLPSGSRICTVDPSKQMLGEVKRNLAQEGLDLTNIEFVQTDASKLDLDDNSFDIVVSVMVLHHLTGLVDVLKQLVRVLKKGGRLLLVDYAPTAGRELEFTQRHSESDFFEPKQVLQTVRGLVSNATLKDHKIWYLVDATK